MAISPAIPMPPKKSILERLPGKLPTSSIPANVDVEFVAKSMVDRFPALTKDCFTDDAMWRDSYAMTGTFRTFYFNATVAQQWLLLREQRQITSREYIPGSSKIIPFGPESAYLECQLKFTTSNPVTECSAFFSMVPSPTMDGGWKIWILRTVLEQLPGHGNVDVLEPRTPLLADNGASSELLSDRGSNGSSTFVNGNGSDAHATGLEDVYVNGHTSQQTNGTTVEHVESINDMAEQQSIHHFQAVIIGGGQAGLSTGGRLRALGVSYVVIEKNEQVGDAWRLRYESARLHTVREYSHLPFDRTFGPSYPEYLGKEDLAKGHLEWARKFGINIWLSSTVTSGDWDQETGLYTLTVRRKGTSTPTVITAKHVVIATGAGSQTPIMPLLANRDKFRGQVLHSADYKSAEQWRHKAGIVLGTANTAHDVADDMYEAGMSVTMVQRSRTFVLPVEYIQDRYHKLYNSKLSTETSDRIMFTNPVSIARLTSANAFHAMARAQPERWEALERVGFKVDPYGDIQDAINVRLGGHYIDVGTSAKIAKGWIKVKSDALAVSFYEDGLEFADGTRMRADVVVFATGFVGNLRNHVEQIFGKEVGDRAGDCFGLNEEGEILGAFKPVQQRGLWYIGGALGHARWYSRFLALSIKADQLGTPLPVYEDCKHRLVDEWCEV
ncbi:uncharacterized protein Z519_12168 [Cladophialophora bantiana CBS 173.52]|uniref:FAD/NAD(P)-binding domain-containing protein n=1 Tax=Cladophialophora bantiana (strain ATCC 10958 / CBS 173.52 / CDC B-1940 / NIH 8579) TaxID=1442370 RepID=A0A0D2H8P7_CLAB1|nr:uncharacterized protein Z519_12168 [Cladophialophora bantiana CBS 173.52]KIW87265.1 hypothetical protein Z519_12168 [Cladophialophora bantiana CBS 173.52]